MIVRVRALTGGVVLKPDAAKTLQESVNGAIFYSKDAKNCFKSRIKVFLLPKNRLFLPQKLFVSLTYSQSLSNSRTENK